MGKEIKKKALKAWAEERWEIDAECGQKVIRLVGAYTDGVLYTADNATDDQMRVATLAPEMLELLEHVIAMDEVSAAPLSRSDLDDIVAIIKKARGEQRGDT